MKQIIFKNIIKVGLAPPGNCPAQRSSVFSLGSLHTCLPPTSPPAPAPSWPTGYRSRGEGSWLWPPPSAVSHRKACFLTGEDPGWARRTCALSLLGFWAPDLPPDLQEGGPLHRVHTSLLGSTWGFVVMKSIRLSPSPSCLGHIQEEGALHWDRIQRFRVFNPLSSSVPKGH